MTNPNERVDRALDRRARRSGGPLPRAISMAELEEVFGEHGDLRDGDRWGRWTYHAGPRVLCLEEKAYDVDLDRCRTAEEVYDWIVHIAGKVWATDADIGALVRALRVVVGREAT